MNKGLGILLMLGAGLWYYAKRTANAVSVKLQNLHFVSINVNSIQMQVSLLIHNPLLVDVVIDDIVGDVYIMDKFCATIDQSVNQVLAAKQSSTLSANFSIGIQEIGQALWDNIMSGDVSTLAVRFDGYVSVAGMRIPIDREFIVKDLLDASRR